jgi:hypothetical protein
MSDDFEKTKKDFKKRNRYAAMLKDQGDFKGAFSLKVVDSRKQDYKRSKMRTNEIYEEEQD